MNSHADILSKIKGLNLDEFNETDETSTLVHDQNFHDLISSQVNKLSDKSMAVKDIITELSESPENTSDPEKLAKLQSYLSEYSNYIALVSAIARKAVNTVETLGKAQ